MFTKIKDVMGSREFQTGLGQVGIAVVSIVASTVVSKLISGTLNTGLESLMDKIHGTELLETVSEVVEGITAE